MTRAEYKKQWEARNRERISAARKLRDRERRATDPAFRARLSKASRAYYQRNKEAVKAKARATHLLNRETINAKARAKRRARRKCDFCWDTKKPAEFFGASTTCKKCANVKSRLG